jgi:2-enoate reductase
MLLEMIDYYKIKVMKYSCVESYANGVAKVKTHENNHTNINNRAYRMVMLGAEGEDHFHDVKADHIIVSIGYTPNQALYDEIKADNVYLIGDAEKPTNIMDAIWKAYEIAMKL